VENVTFFPFVTASPEPSFRVAVIAAELEPSAEMPSAGSALRVIEAVVVLELPPSLLLSVELPPHDIRRVTIQMMARPNRRCLSLIV